MQIIPRFSSLRRLCAPSIWGKSQPPDQLLVINDLYLLDTIHFSFLFYGQHFAHSAHRPTIDVAYLLGHIARGGDIKC